MAPSSNRSGSIRDASIRCALRPAFWSVLAVLAAAQTGAVPNGAVQDDAVQGGAVPAAPRAPAPPLFVERGSELLPGVATTCGSREKDYIVEVNGGGLVLGDFDGEGSIDLVVIDGSTLERVRAGEPGLPPRLFLNRGDGHMRPAAAESAAEGGPSWRIAGGRWGMGGAAGDLNGDGHLDLVITEWGPDRVLLNEGGAGLRELGASAGLEGARWGTSAALCDYDRDGHLDLAVVNYLSFDPAEIASRTAGTCRWKGHAVMCGPEGMIAVHDQLYRGRGDGTFVERTAEAGFRPAHAGFGLGIMTLDFDDDGDTDLYVTNDSTPNHMWRNEGDGTFEEVGVRLGIAHDEWGKEQAGMGIACGDFAGDAYPDLFVTNFSGEDNACYVSVKGRTFRHRADRLGLGGVASLPYLGWGAGAHDFDHDADLDLYVLNGHVYPQADAPGTDTTYAQPDFLFRNGGERFTLEPLSDGPPSVTRAGAAADLDGDGDLDLVALDIDGPVRVLENRGASGHWLRVRLRGRGTNTQGIGARVEAVWEGGARREEVRTAGGFHAALPAEAHFGLGPAERLTKLVVRWPSGTVQTLEDVAVDRVLVVEEPAPAEEGE